MSNFYFYRMIKHFFNNMFYTTDFFSTIFLFLHNKTISMVIFLILFLGIVFLIIPYTITEENADSLLAGYNTMSDKERKGFDLISFLKDYKKFNTSLGVSILTIGTILYFLTNEFVIIFFITTYTLIAHIFFMIKSKKFYSSQSLKNNNTAIYLLVGVLVFTLGLFSLTYFK